MFESCRATPPDLDGLVVALSGLEPASDDVDRANQLDLLERVKAACAAAQAKVTVALAESQARVRGVAGARPRRGGGG